MKPLQEHYPKELYKQLGYWGTWLPSNKLQLGDIGILEDGVFLKVSTLNAQGIEFEAMLRSGTTSHEYTSQGTLSLLTNATGSTNEKEVQHSSASGIRIDFKNENSIYFRVNKAKTRGIENMVELEKEILQRQANGTWQKDWVFVSEIVHAQETLVLVSREKGASAEFELDANIKKPVNLNVGVHHKMVYEGKLAYKMQSDSKTTPLFKLMGIHSSWFGKDKLASKSVQFGGIKFRDKTNEGLVEITPEFI